MGPGPLSFRAGLEVLECRIHPYFCSDNIHVQLAEELGGDHRG
jgi:hypothetical protein